LKIYTKRIIKTTSFSLSVGLASIACNLENFFDESEEESFLEFKQYLSEQIGELDGKRLVLIVDGLDRCKPGFLVRLFEILKHLFDIDGLFVILTFSKVFLTQSLKSAHGFTFENDNIGEHCIDKFIDSRIEMYISTEREYEKVLGGFLKEYGMPDELFADLLDNGKTWYLCKAFRRHVLSLRQAKKACEEIVAFFKSKNWNILSIYKEMLPHLVCKKILNIKFIKYNQAYNSASVGGVRIDSAKAIEKKEKDERRRKIWMRCQEYFGNKEYSTSSNFRYRCERFNLLSQYGLALAASDIQSTLSYDILYKEVVAFASFLYNSEGVADQFAEAYLSEVFEMLEKIFK
jgi:hypothetical protein